jgi:hypothetical protein
MFYIVNYMDRPTKALVAQMIDGKLYYMDVNEFPHLKECDGMDMRQATPMEKFGFECVIDNKKKMVKFTKVGKSVARYNDDTLRDWQGQEEVFTLPLREEPEKLPQVVSEGSIDIIGMKLRCYILDNGKRIIDAEDVDNFFSRLSNENIDFTTEDAQKLAKFVKGVK